MKVILKTRWVFFINWISKLNIKLMELRIKRLRVYHGEALNVAKSRGYAFDCEIKYAKQTTKLIQKLNDSICSAYEQCYNRLEELDD